MLVSTGAAAGQSLSKQVQLQKVEWLGGYLPDSGPAVILIYPPPLVTGGIKKRQGRKYAENPRL